MIHLANTPVLETERLILRAPGPQDWEACRPFLCSERARYIGGPYDPGAAWRMFCHVIGHWVLRGWGLFVFQPKRGGAACGNAGPWFPEGWPEREISWTIWSDQAEGQGYASEAARAARAHAYDALGWDTAVSYIDPANVRSIALAERLGATPDAAAARPEPGDIVYRHPAPAGQLSGAA